MSDVEVYQRQGLGQPSGIGKRCGLVLVDFVNGFVDPALLGGQHVAEAAGRTLALLQAFRARNLPVAHSRVVFAEDGSDHNVFCRKAPALTRFTESAECSQILPLLAPEPGERVIRKQGASAFFATSLADWLRARGVDTVVVVGCTTSGCVRATAIDAMQHDFMTVVVEDCVGDRAPGPHQASLFDLQQKYADVMSRDALLSVIS
ncbi:isochorismatase family protein [uncultured Pigmentiphaga sp.]|jgi:Amidases related to nicotinamidase|uniref:isochorismatase family protein n=1 Tax=uncultured Pigmentiphaga sp. TaxID=340361 RepID=UPI0026242DC0|nr:isochorismatase family protein [uncultured Pigmentiphaga sp.]